jgi:hypothetical protein
MKVYTLVLLCAAMALFSCGEKAPQAPEPVSIMTQTQPDSLLRHVVLFQFKESASAEDIAMVEEAFGALPEKIAEIADFEWGTNNSPEGINRGYTHCFFLSFQSEADRDAYLPHPAHQAFGEVLGPYLEQALVVDYWTR